MKYFIQICLTKEKKPDFVSKYIMRFERSKFSHALCLFEDVDGVVKIFHSIGKGTVIEEVGKFFEEHDISASYLIPMDCDREEFSDYVNRRTKLNVSYSVSQYVNQGLRLLGLPLVLIRNGDRKAICSEEMFCTLRKSEIWSRVMGADQDTISPRMLDSILSALVKEGVITRGPDKFEIKGKE